MQKCDVIIVGGRVAGASLAIQLGRAGLRVLLLERDTLPSLPAASSPTIFSPVMALLDELGVSEQDYAANTPKLRQFVVEGENAFVVRHTIPEKHGRDYAYAIDRARFDEALWRQAAAQPTVDARLNWAALGLLFEGKRVVGVRAKDTTSGVCQTYHADYVVGADGRFSAVARWAGAAEHILHDRHPTTVYYAYWRGAQPFDEQGPILHLFRGRHPYGMLLLDSADNTTLVVIEGKADWWTTGNTPTDRYVDVLRQHPSIWRRLKTAELIEPVRGMKRIRNLYRDAGGPGWALVGDALHQKDPLDGQGIYNTLFTAKMLFEAILECRAGTPWPQSLDTYAARVHAELDPMFRVTMGRVAREIHLTYPDWFAATVGRWLYTDPNYLDRWIRLLIRDLPPDEWFSYPHLAKSVLSGVWRDLTG